MRPRLALTRAGGAALAATGALAVVSLVTGNNLLYLLLSVLLAHWLVAVVAGAVNLRGLDVRRELPADLFAGVEARGRLVVRSRRRAGAARSVEVRELDLGEARGVAARVGPGCEAGVPVGWRFAHRGEAWLGRVRLASSWPWGLVVAQREVDLTSVVRIAPRPANTRVRGRSGGAGYMGGSTRAGSRGLGDLEGLRDYVPGDPLARVHWPTTARTGRPVVVLRGVERSTRVLVEVPELTGEAWERALEVATGQVLDGFAARREVGLRVAGRVWPPGAGTTWRRTLLDALTQAPRRDAP